MSNGLQADIKEREIGWLALIIQIIQSFQIVWYIISVWNGFSGKEKTVIRYLKFELIAFNISELKEIACVSQTVGFRRIQNKKWNKYIGKKSNQTSETGFRC